MKTSRVFTWLLLTALLLAALPVLGQDISLPQTYTFDDGVTFHYPEGGKIKADQDTSDFLKLSLNDAVIYVSNFPILGDYDLTTDSTLVEAAKAYIEQQIGLNFDESAAEATELNGHEALLYPYMDKEDAWLLVLVRFGEDGAFAVMDTSGAEESLVTAIAASFEAGETSAAASGVTCTVSAAQEKTAQLRVGPGTNRTAYAFLPAKTDFTPLGRAEADDGSVWFQLDKDEVAPKAAASEAWVAAEAVETSGDCESVGEASAPPIVPIVVAPPANTGGGDSGGGDSGGGGPTVLPASGSWTLRFSSSGKGSCLGTQTIDVPVSLPNTPVSVSISGSRVFFDGNAFQQVQPGVYSGLIDFSDGSSVQVVLRVASPTLFTGEMIGNVNLQGHQCSVTIPVTVTKN